MALRAGYDMFIDVPTRRPAGLGGYASAFQVGRDWVSREAVRGSAFIVLAELLAPTITQATLSRSLQRATSGELFGRSREWIDRLRVAQNARLLHSDAFARGVTGRGRASAGVDRGRPARSVGAPVRPWVEGSSLGA